MGRSTVRSDSRLESAAQRAARQKQKSAPRSQIGALRLAFLVFSREIALTYAYRSAHPDDQKLELESRDHESHDAQQKSSGRREAGGGLQRPRAREIGQGEGDIYHMDTAEPPIIVNPAIPSRVCAFPRTPHQRAHTRAHGERALSSTATARPIHAANLHTTPKQQQTKHPLGRAASTWPTSR